MIELVFKYFIQRFVRTKLLAHENVKKQFLRNRLFLLLFPLSEPWQFHKQLLARSEARRELKKYEIPAF